MDVVQEEEEGEVLRAPAVAPVPPLPFAGPAQRLRAAAARAWPGGVGIWTRERGGTLVLVSDDCGGVEWEGEGTEGEGGGRDAFSVSWDPERGEICFGGDDARALARARAALAAALEREEKEGVGKGPAGGLYDTPSLVVPGLFVGTARAARNWEALSARGITHIVRVGTGLEEPFRERGGVYHGIDVLDSVCADLTPHLDAAADFIADAHERGEAVLVHCLQGASRSPTVAAAFLVREHGMSAADALAAVRAARPAARPNRAFLAQLRAFEASCHGRSRRDRDCDRDCDALDAGAARPSGAVGSAGVERCV